MTGHLLPEATEHDQAGSAGGAYAVTLGGFLMLLCARAARRGLDRGPARIAAPHLIEGGAPADRGPG